MPDDLVLEHLKALRRDIVTKADLAGATAQLATKSDLEHLSTREELETLRHDMGRHFVEVETRITTEVHELISLLREMVASRDKLAARVTQLEADMDVMKRRAG